MAKRKYRLPLKGVPETMVSPKDVFDEIEALRVLVEAITRQRCKVERVTSKRAIFKVYSPRHNRDRFGELNGD